METRSKTRLSKLRTKLSYSTAASNTRNFDFSTDIICGCPKSQLACHARMLFVGHPVKIPAQGMRE
jgi:hypothetical protein